MHKDHVWCVDGSGNQAVGCEPTNVNVLLLDFFGRRCLRFLGGTQHILAPDHATRSRTNEGRQVNAKFLRKPSCRR